MRFAFTDDQVAFARAAREVLERTCAPKDVRAAWDDDDAHDAGRWRALATVGLTGALVDEANGGVGLDEVSLVAALEEAGRACLPEPLLEGAVCAALLRDAADDEARARWLPALASGDAVATVAHPANGTARAAGSADLILAHRGDDVYAVERAQATFTPQRSLDGSRRLATVAFEPGSARLLASGDDARALLGDAFDRGALGTAAELLGVGARAIELAVAHAKDRRQFGAPIGSFQAVKHLLADALLGIEFAKPAVYRAAWSVAHRIPARARDVSMAKAMASDAAVAACRAALQVHGAIGYTKEHDLHLWLARGFALASAWGDAARHRARVERAILG